MSGLLRNLLTALVALLALARGRQHEPTRELRTRFLVTPLDTGIGTLKSDRYALLAEAAQVDFVIRCGLLLTLRRTHCRFVNASQLVQFIRPVHLFDRIEVRTRILFADDRWVYFSHAFHVRGELRGTVLVKMKFKRDRLTIAPLELFGVLPDERPDVIDHWNAALAQDTLPIKTDHV